MAKSKKNPQKEILTKYDLLKAEKKWEDQLHEMVYEATQNGELLARTIIMLALKNKFGFDAEEFTTLFKEADRIGDKISDMDGRHKNYSIATVCKELEAAGVVFDEVEMWKNSWYKGEKEDKNG